MPDNLKTKSCLICDGGLFVELASRLARDFGEVRYFMDWSSAYPRASLANIGTGLPGVERVPTFWDYVPDADVVVFPDIYDADTQRVVSERFHKPVWGHRDAESLELDRWGTRKLQKELGIAAPRTRHLVGVESLADHLRRVEDKWVKISCFRGDGETFHHETWHTTEIYLNHFRDQVGALAESYEFLVEDHIDGIEIGYDGWTVHGDWPEASYWGFEMKDKAYVGRFSMYADLPESVRSINEAVSPVLRMERSVGFCSFEFRLSEDGTAYMIDPCMRCGSPPIEATMEGYDNIAEIIWEGANGRMASPRSTGEYLAIAEITSEFALTNWVPIDVPTSIRRWVKLRNAAVIDGKLYHVPIGNAVKEIGAVVAVADTLEEAKRLVVERAARVSGYSVEVHVEALDAAEDEIEAAREYGIEFQGG